MDDWILAGKIAAEAREYSKQLVKAGARLAEVAEQIEEKIRSLGAVPAFPVNISMNEIAAHYAPVFQDELVFSEQLVKIDIGACVNGAIGDTAYTVDLSGRHQDLVKAAEDALAAAIKEVSAGVTLGAIGRAIGESIESHGFKPVRNLSGHGLSLYNVHDRPSVPNYDTGDGTTLTEGQVIAIEPFATDGSGIIKESGIPVIYMQTGARPVRGDFTRKIFSEIKSYNGLPFATRWLANKFGEGRTRLALRELMQADNIKGFPPLPEAAGGLVSQAEHTVIVKDKAVVTTSD